MRALHERQGAAESIAGARPMGRISREVSAIDLKTPLGKNPSAVNFSTAYRPSSYGMSVSNEKSISLVEKRLEGSRHRG